VGVSFGAVVSPSSRFVAGASVRFNSQLRAAAPDSATRVSLPFEANVGAHYQVVPGSVMVATSIGYAGWGTASSALVAAGQGGARNVWSFGFGVEAASVRLGRGLLPLRLGYRWRQLPFPIGGSPLAEHALAGGIGFDAAGGRATVDVTVESGARTAGALRETFTNLLLGLTIRP
jgi:hypothetical protein